MNLKKSAKGGSAYGRKKTALLVLTLVALALVSFLIIKKNFLVAADIKPTPKQVFLPEISYNSSDFQLKIEKLNINVPVIPDVDAADKVTYFAALQKGVAQMSGTVKPDTKGNVVIFGHSNYYENDSGLYKTIFKSLDELAAGDQIILHYKGQDYTYRVEKQQLVEPTETWIITAPYDLTLMTCWPPGTVEKRLIVFTNKIAS